MFSVRRRRPLPMYGPPETLERLRTFFRYIFDDSVAPYEGTSKPEPRAPPDRAGVPADVAGRGGAAAGVPPRAPSGLRLPDRPAGLHHRRRRRSPTRSARACRGSRCWCSMRSGGVRTRRTSALPRRSRPRSAIGARRTYLTHLTHETGHAELAGAAPAGIVPAYDGLTVEVDVITAGVRTHAAGCARWHAWAPAPAPGRPVRRFGAVHAGVRRRRAAGESASTSWCDQAKRSARSRSFAEGLGQAPRPRARARDRRLGAGRDGAAQGAPPAGVERAGTTRARGVFRGSGARQRRSRPRSTRRSAASIRAACWSTSSASRAERRRRWPSISSCVPGWRRRSAQAAHRHLVFITDPASGALRDIALARRHRLARRAARRGRALQRAFAGRAPAGRAGRHRHRGAARRRRPGDATGQRRRTCSPIPRRSMPRCSGRRTPISGRASTC